MPQQIRTNAVTLPTHSLDQDLRVVQQPPALGKNQQAYRAGDIDTKSQRMPNSGDSLLISYSAADPIE
jgi:hypothetical protein